MNKAFLIFIPFFMIFLSACGAQNAPQLKNTLNWEVQDFEFINQDEETVKLEDLKGEVWLANFIFTNCSTVCPPMTYNMSQIQGLLAEEKLNIPIVSFSVDPEIDSPEHLKEFGQKFNADFTTWNFLTGYSQEHIEEFALESFKAAVIKPEDTDQVTHGTSFYLIDQSGKIVRRYDGYIETPFQDIINDIKTLKTN